MDEEENLNEELEEYVEPQKKRTRQSGNAGRCQKQKTKRNYPQKSGKKRGKKKAFHGNQHTPKTKNNEHVAAVAVSQKKVKKVQMQKKSGQVEGFRFIDMQVLELLVSSLACPVCLVNKTLYVEEDELKKKVLLLTWSSVVPVVTMFLTAIHQKLWHKKKVPKE